jgi:hypothetical protein
MTKSSPLSRRLPLKSCPIFAAAFSLALALPVSAEAAPDPACEPMFTAITKLLQTPNHQYMSQSSATYALQNGGRMRTSESISTEDTSYVKINDQWRKVPFTPQDLLKQQEESRQNSKESCHFLRDDASEGDAAVYDAHSEGESGKSEVQIWISKVNGLPLREEIDLDLGGEKGMTHSSVRFDYEHVDPPKDAK